MDTADDELNADGDCSLREAIVSANNDAAEDNCTAGSGSDLILFDASLTGETITLNIPTTNEDASADGDLDINDPDGCSGGGSGDTLTIEGPTADDPDSIVIDGNGIDRVIHVVNNDLTLRNLTIQNGGGVTFGGGVLSDNECVLRIENCIIENNTASNPAGGADGGGVWSNGDLELFGSVISNNIASGDGNIDGGGIFMNGSSSLTSIANRIVENVAERTSPAPVAGATHNGGGLAFFGNTALLQATEVSNNTIDGLNALARGGGIAATTLNIFNSTISGNSAVTDGTPRGGGIHVIDSLTMNNSTVTKNEALTPSGSTKGGGINNRFTGATINVSNSIIADNTTSDGDNSGLRWHNQLIRLEYTG